MREVWWLCWNLSQLSLLSLQCYQGWTCSLVLPCHVEARAALLSSLEASRTRLTGPTYGLVQAAGTLPSAPPGADTIGMCRAAFPLTAAQTLPPAFLHEADLG